MKDRTAYNAYHKEYQRRRYHRIRAEIIESLGGACCECGADEGLEVHHTDPSKKRFFVSKIWSSSGKLKKELKKCILLCNECHKQEHS